MSVHQPSNIYRERLSSLNYGLALWDPKPVDNLYNHISIGDVGYLLENGAFMRLFNVTLPWDDPSNSLLEVPEQYKRLELGHFINITLTLTHTTSSDQGALLSLPDGGHSEDVIRTKVFEDYIRDNADSWFRWSRREGFPVERMEDLILVTGCTLVASWAAAVFDNSNMSTAGSDAATISLDIRKSNRAGVQFFWCNNRGNVDYHNSYFDPTVEGRLHRNQCVFFRGFRARRIRFRTRIMRAAAEPLPDDPDNHKDDEIQVTRIPDGSKDQYRDPLVVILDYIEERAQKKCQEDTMAKDIEDIIAIAHYDDLQLFEDIETVTADAMERFLRERKMPLLIENGAAILRDPADDRSSVSNDDKSANFYAVAELNGESVPLDIHPVLTKYSLKLEINGLSITTTISQRKI
ncbi:hypothetical protein BGY98DRAFT_1099432 [Russula aff. rugulosa BPL654]|nr:hypothetical protein BGY98DRAFT_1099432 [Russula aff. rugulosa BPL654]